MKRFIKLTIVLFGCLAGFLFVNKYVKFIDMSSINVETKDGFERQKVVVKQVDNRIREENAMLMSNLNRVVFDGQQINTLKTKYGPVHFLVTYKNEYYATFGHFLTNNRYQHSYNLLLYKNKGELYLKVDIEGVNERHYVEKMRLINDTDRLQ